MATEEKNLNEELGEEAKETSEKTKKSKKADKKNEALTIDMDEFVKNKFPEAYEVAQEIVIEIAKVLKYKIERVEVGYLALHIQRVCEI